MIIFGDSAYKKRSFLRSYFAARVDGAELSEHFRHWNGAMKRVRVSIEWNYGYTATLFPYLTNKRKLKVMKFRVVVSKIYIVATLLRNFHAILYGCQTSNYFELYIKNKVEFLEKYITQTDFI